MSDPNASVGEIDDLIRESFHREKQIGMERSLLELLGCMTHEEKMVCSMKTLYSDFVVRELSPLYNHNEPLTLELNAEDCSSVGGAASKKRQRDGDAQAKDNGSEIAPPSYTAICEALQSVLHPEDYESLKKGLEELAEKIVLQHVEKKEDRSKIHQAVKAHLSATHLSSTENGLLTIAKATAAGRREQRQRSTPLRQRSFLHFTVYKENIDSSQVFRLMAKHLHRSTRQIEFCGTKDKRAVTLQRVAMRDIDPSVVRQLNHRSFGPRGQTVRVCGFQTLEKGLRLGDANGNHFTIVLRFFPQHTTSRLAPRLDVIEKALSEYGAVNYFGPQRFGTTQILTSDIGIAILQGQVKKAIELMLRSKALFVPDVAPAVELFCAGQYDDALQSLPYFCMQERDMLRHLVQNPNDFSGTLQTIPRTLAMLYFHSVQSLLWNQMASLRLSDGSRLKAEVGDLVLEKVYQTRLSEHEARQRASEPGSVVPQLICLSEFICEEENDTKLPAIRGLTSSDPLEAFLLSDVVLTVPGPDPQLLFPASKGCSKEDYVRAMQELNIKDELLDAEAGRLTKIFHFHGTYRPLIVRPQRVKLALREAKHWNAPVVETDLEKFNREVGHPAAENTENSLHNNRSDEATSSSIGHSGPIQAVQVDFSLPSGCYATCVLREFAVFSLHTHINHFKPDSSEENHPIGSSGSGDHNGDC